MPRHTKCLALCGMIVAWLVWVAPVQADWDPTQEAKWVQLPDLLHGLNINATWTPELPWTRKVLADDWLCTSTDRVTDIHIWGSWLNDILPMNDPNQVRFKLSIHEDVPAGPNNPYSHPGKLLWKAIVGPGEFKVRPLPIMPPIVREPFYDPNTGRIVGFDFQVWQYNFLFKPEEAFLQKGSPKDPVIYWLDVQAIPNNPIGVNPAVFGWKTALPANPEPWGPTNPIHRLDDAVWADTPDFGVDPVTPWVELRYPQWPEVYYPYWGHSLDLAFVITPEPSILGLLGFGALSLLRRRR